MQPIRTVSVNVKIHYKFHLQGTNEILRLFIGLQGMQHAGGKLLDMVK